jgi:hypothetical protein
LSLPDRPWFRNLGRIEGLACPIRASTTCADLSRDSPSGFGRYRGVPCHDVGNAGRWVRPFVPLGTTAGMAG